MLLASLLTCHRTRSWIQIADWVQMQLCCSFQWPNVFCVRLLFDGVTSFPDLRREKRHRIKAPRHNQGHRAGRAVTHLGLINSV
jgi:hypothetical protein